MIRIMVFVDRPDSVLLVAPDSDMPALPAMAAPFTKTSVSVAMVEAGVDARVSESIAGRWTTAIVQATKADKAERAQKQMLHEATVATLLRSANDPALRDRALTIQRKHEVDDSLRTLKAKLVEAKAKAATRGAFMPIDEFRKLTARVDALKEESLALQTRLGELRDAEKAANREADKAERSAFPQRFMTAARKMLDPDTYNELVREAAAGAEEEA